MVTSGADVDPNAVAPVLVPVLLDPVVDVVVVVFPVKNPGLSYMLLSVQLTY